MIREIRYGISNREDRLELDFLINLPERPIGRLSAAYNKTLKMGSIYECLLHSIVEGTKRVENVLHVAKW